MKDYRHLVTGALQATEISSPTSYRWFGALSAPIPPDAEAAMSAEDARRFLHYALKNRLYADFYCPGEARPPLEPLSSPSRVGGTSAFLATLSEANQGSGSREGGWQVIRTDGEFLVVERQGLQVWAHPREVSDEGGRVTVTMPKELFRLSPGFYMALSDCELPEEDFSQQIRYYFNLQPGAAAALMRSLTTGLNRGRVAFRLKVVDDANRYSRSDAGVLYAHRRDLPAVLAQVEMSCRELDPPLKPSTPAFVQELAPGLGFAENPPDASESFGTSRCELLAEALLRAHEQSIVEINDQLAIVDECFAQAGLTLEAPYLNSRADNA
jgi:hypothetical protein